MSKGRKGRSGMRQAAANSRTKQCGQHDGEDLSMFERRLQKWLDEMERLRLTEYLRYVDDRRKLLWNSFLSGIARGVGTAIGFTILGAIVILILQDLARHNLPLIGVWLDKLMNVVQNGIQ